MHVIREAREIGNMRRVLPTLDQLVVGVGPVISVIPVVPSDHGLEKA
jgi:hypothetical protein